MKARESSGVKIMLERGNCKIMKQFQGHDESFALILNEIRESLSEDVTRFDFRLKGITLAALLRLDCGDSRTERRSNDLLD